ncbi:MAG: amidohydrolase [Lachnospiraceae bacterium]|jgi:aminobenzoyl-glutamate utilization protein B|nr:amidohydrolase [Lachnospiraceae bacterium]MCH4069922.1 amidohydrolase [Lachnospiraceae bacterium]MCI1332415.1 amidohydrolase [Lachnospiraceae bacterium]MCI1361802.1 amidohydrolase [Lachnospiraceae bacterium]MCI1381043.1 amidohydrolase [Lachnospiraceae bacterium]
MEETKEAAISSVDEIAERLCSMSDALWDHPQVKFQETYAAELFETKLQEEGFAVRKGLGGIPTAFSGTFGSGRPVIGLLGEFDALPGMSQEPGILEKKAVQEGAPGHGCGHNLLGVGAFGAAVAVKRYLQQNHLPGTVVFFGCPAEEGGSGKGFMARAHVFDDVDAAFTWHPGEVNSVSVSSTMANYQICYRFYGKASHAAMAPERGRSALDALELMNVGVQFLREHVPNDTRIHYAITNTGGSAPGVVQDYAEAMYLMRAANLDDVRELYRRVNLVAQGAATMTETKARAQFIKACSNILVNSRLCKVMQDNLLAVPAPEYSKEEQEYARALQATAGSGKTYFDQLYAGCTDAQERKAFEVQKSLPLHAGPLPLGKESSGFVSSDVGDVSWNCPTAQINGTTMPAGLAMHSWQVVSVGKSSIAHKGMLYAAKVMAGSAIDALTDESVVREAKEEMDRRTGGAKYVCPIPEDVKPYIG